MAFCTPFTPFTMVRFSQETLISLKSFLQSFFEAIGCAITEQ